MKRLLIICFLTSALCCAMPVFADTHTRYDITAYGAVGDDRTLNTASIQAAIDGCHSAGGGVVYVPSGVYRTGSIQLKSHVTLELSPGARIVGSSEMQDYPQIGHRHNELGEIRSLIWAMNAEHIGITGSGVIDLNGAAFMDFKRSKVNQFMERTLAYDERQKREAVVWFLDRPNQLVFLHNCSDLRLEGFTLRDSPCWTVTVSECSRVRIHSLVVDNNLQTCNSDGIHISASSDVTISDCIVRAGDDCIAITSSTNWSRLCEHVVVSNCVLTSRSSCVRIGNQNSRVRDVVVSNLVMDDSNRGLSFFAKGDGYVENVLIDGVQMQTRKFAGDWWGKGEPMVAVAFDGGRISGVQVRRVRADSENSIVMAGPGISDFEIRDWAVTLRKGPNVSHFNRYYELLPAPYIASPDPEVHIPFIYAEQVDGVKLDGITADVSLDDGPADISPVFRSCKIKMTDIRVSVQNDRKK